MPEEKKKQQKGSKHEPKEQRKGRSQRQQAPPVPEKKIDTPIVSKTDQKPVIPEPGPEFYQSLKRETEEILKITEEDNARYKKKEIQSNWKKYEVPVETYDDIEDVENQGADYEKLTQAPLSIGSHFQFKHEKSWDTITTPSEYDKYFDINLENLAIAISTLPFYERNDLDLNLFQKGDIISMDGRTKKFRQKYFNEKPTDSKDRKDSVASNSSVDGNEIEHAKTCEQEIKKVSSPYIEKCEFDEKLMTTIENIELQTDKLKDIVKTNESSKVDKVSNPNNSKEADKILTFNEQDDLELKKINKDITSQSKLDKLEDITEPNENLNSLILNNLNKSEEILGPNKPVDLDNVLGSNKTDDLDDLLRPNKPEKAKGDDFQLDDFYPVKKFKAVVPELKNMPSSSKVIKTSNKSEPAKIPIVEPEEDLEKWLDDFLDS